MDAGPRTIANLRWGIRCDPWCDRTGGRKVWTAAGTFARRFRMEGEAILRLLPFHYVPSVERDSLIAVLSTKPLAALGGGLARSSADPAMQC